MIIVTVNSGSTSVKLAAFDVQTSAHLHRVEHDQPTGAKLDPRAVLTEFLAKLHAPPDAIAHRVVHGGRRFPGPALIDPDVLESIGALSQLAPLHNPKALAWVVAAGAAAGTKVPQVAVFDTSFFFQLPRVAGEYALPASLGVDAGVRRYGFHGLAHQAMWERFSQLRPELPLGGRLITLQLGGGCSVAAIERGKPLDTSMGFSPLEGLVMGTRSGDLDPAAVAYLQHRLAKSSDEIIALLNREAGVAGMSGGETNLGKLAADKSPRSQFVVDLYCYRARKYIGAYLTVLGGCDGIVFGGGVGEHVPAVRERILAGMRWAGIEIDTDANLMAQGAEAQFHKSGSPVGLYAIPVEEETVLARAAFSVLKSI
jgi:acetate kinase